MEPTQDRRQRQPLPHSLRPRLLALGVALLAAGRTAGYIEAPFSLGSIIAQSPNILLMRVEQVDKQKNLIIYRKVRDLKGTYPGDTIRHNIGFGGFSPREWQNIMAWAEVGQFAVFFRADNIGEVCIQNYWYQCVGGEWYAMNHAEPYLLRTFAGRPEKLADAVAAILAGQEVAVPCMVDGDKNALQLRTAKIQRLKASLKLTDYNAQRDFVGWGGEDFRPISGMPGFTHCYSLPRVDPGAGGIALADFDGDGKTDFCLYGHGRVILMQNAGSSYNEIPLPLDGGARSAAWADLDADGRPDLLLATPTGPRLFLNNGGGKFKDITVELPRENYYNLTAASWIYADGDKRPDILLADGIRGLRLYRNRSGDADKPGEFKTGKWYYTGPFENANGSGFDAAYPPEQGVNLAHEYQGKGGEKCVWSVAPIEDGKINNLALFRPGFNDFCVIYLYREFDCPNALELPVSLAASDALTVWLNGQKLLAEKEPQPSSFDAASLTLQLRPGKNALLAKVCQITGEFSLYFDVHGQEPAGSKLFEDVSDKVGLGEKGIGTGTKGHHLVVCDVDADGREDFLFGAGTGILVMNTPEGFVPAADCGVSYDTANSAPVFGDYNGDRLPDLFLPQHGVSKLFRNEGKGRFSDVTTRSGDLKLPIGNAVCASWADFENRGRLDLLIGCLKGTNRYLRNNGNGTFTDATAEIGFDHRIFNTRGICAADLNKDRVADVLMANEGQESVVLLGNADRAGLRVAAADSPDSEVPAIRGNR